ncbi:hypothetical protein DPMN_152122 [Dreissena polymorpha]|uniref:Uncharacterized protein n=1 Tax=Dreissena polymorpha TaxID=45954 RepID=A0A9D4FHQ6_DREPO|nr:hypothetical protein DPMN_152122 [Dreissena polymorpha]
MSIAPLNKKKEHIRACAEWCLDYTAITTKQCSAPNAAFQTPSNIYSVYALIMRSND